MWKLRLRDTKWLALDYTDVMWKTRVTLASLPPKSIMQCFPLIGLISALSSQAVWHCLHSNANANISIYLMLQSKTTLCQLLVALCLTSRLWSNWKQSSDLQVFHYCLLLKNKLRIEKEESGERAREGKGRKEGGRERRKKRARWTLKILTEQDASVLLKVWSRPLYQISGTQS